MKPLAKFSGTLIVRGGGNETRYELNEASTLTCGRSRFCDIVIKGSGVARRHVKFFYRQGAFVVESIGKEPFQVNSVNKLAWKLNEGDRLQLGLNEILFYPVHQVEVDDSQVGDESNFEKKVTQLRLHLDQSKLMLLERTTTRVEITYDDRSTEVVQEGFQWEVDPPGNILVNEAHELVPMKAGPARVGVRLGPFFEVIDVQVEDFPLEEIEIVMPDEPLYEGESLRLQALGRYRDESGILRESSVTHLVEWKASEDIVSFSEEVMGQMKALKIGCVEVTAQSGQIIATPVKVTIESAVLKGLQVRLESNELEAGNQYALFVEGVSSNGELRPYQEEVQWEIFGDSCLRVEGRFLQALAPGKCCLKAYTAFLESNECALEVTVSQIRDGHLVLPDEVLPGSRLRPTLRVLSVNGHTYDVSPLVSFTTDNPAVLFLQKDGSLEARGEGYATIAGRFMEQEFVKAVQVTATPHEKSIGTFSELIVQPLEESIPVGFSTRFTVTGLDETGQQAEIQDQDLLLTVLTPQILRTSEGGVMGLSPGEGQVQVSVGDLVAICSVSVIPAKIVKITFDPPRLICSLEERVTCKAIALYSDGREVDVTHRADWRVPREVLGSPRAQGLEPVVPGKFSIECHYAGLGKALSFHVVDEEEPKADDDPHQFGDLVLKKAIGVGGMGRVFYAERIEDSKVFAVKVVRTRFLNDTEVAERFIREARLLSQFRHENIVRVYRYGKKDKRPYMVMEHLSGNTFAQLIKNKGPLSPGQAVAVIRAVARALHVLHSHPSKVVHRDVKPGNIFLTHDGEVKLMDFGITRSRDEKGTTHRTGFVPKVIGTASYMSPEQIKKPHDIDARSDLYSLGATFFALLTGRPPFCGETALEIILQHVQDEPVQPSSLVDGIPKEIDQLVGQLLAKDLELRPQSAAEIILALELLSITVDLRDCFL